MALVFFFSLIGLLIATYTDLRGRVVENWLTYSLIAIGLVIHFYYAVVAADAIIFVTAVAVTAAAFLGSAVLWKLGVWAGGDVKLFTGLAALNPYNPNIALYFGLLGEKMFASISMPIFPLTLFIFSVLAMAPWAMVFALRKLAKNKKVAKELWQDFKAKFLQSVVFAGAIIGLNAAVLFFNQNQLFTIPLLILFALLGRNVRALIAVVLAAVAFLLDFSGNVMLFAYLVSIFTVIYLLLKLYSVSKQLLRSRMKISDLEEGMIVAETIVESEGKVRIMPKVEMKKIINYLITNRLQEAKAALQPSGTVIVSSMHAGGVTEEEITRLKQLVKQGKLENRIAVKESTAFVPAILIAYVVLNIIGDLFWNLVFV